MAESFREAVSASGLRDGDVVGRMQISIRPLATVPDAVTARIAALEAENAALKEHIATLERELEHASTRSRRR